MATEKETGTAATQGSTRDVSRAEIEAFFARRQEAYDNLDAAALAADYADDAVIDSPISGSHGKATAADNLRAVFTAFVDIRMITLDLIIDAHRVAQAFNMEGTNLGGLFGLPPSGKPFSMPAVFTYELRDRRIVRERRIYGFTGLLVQVGVLRAKPA